MDDEPPDEAREYITTSLDEVVKVIPFNSDIHCTDEFMKEMRDYRCNGNWQAVKEFLIRMNSFFGGNITARAKRDGNEPYTTRGLLYSFFSNDYDEHPDLPLGVLVEDEDQNRGKTVYKAVYFDRTIKLMQRTHH